MLSFIASTEESAKENVCFRAGSGILMQTQFNCIFKPRNQIQAKTLTDV